MFQTAVDIANRALQHCGALRIDPTLGFAEQSRQAAECSFCYDKLRLSELRRNVWRFATHKAVLRPIDTNTMLLVPALWSSTASYFIGSVVADSTGQLWSSTTGGNVGHDPTLGLPWREYFGPMTVLPYDSTTTYYASELVYTTPGDGTFNVYLSRVNANALDPSLPNVWASTTAYLRNDVVIVYPAWSSGTTYAAGATVTFTDGNVYASLVGSNLNHSPATSPTQWAKVPVLSIVSQPVPSTTTITPITPTPVGEWQRTTTYSIGSFVMWNGTEFVSILNNNTTNPPNTSPTFWVPLAGGTSYISLFDFNTGNPPATTPTAWSSTFVLGPGNPQWLQIGGATFPAGVSVSSLQIIYPLGTGPSSQQRTRNLFRLPGNFLREAPQDPKAGSTSYLGAPSGLAYTDWEYEDVYIVSGEVRPIIYRFVADTVDVTNMDAMFCEGLAARIGLEVCETLTQSAEKLKVIADMYNKFMTEARMVNGIETGSTQPADDDYILARL